MEPVNGTSATQKEISKLRPGDHLCCIYRDAAEQMGIVVPYLICGLNNHEKCLYIIEESTKDDVEKAFSKSGTDLRNYIKAGQFVFLTKEDTYLERGSFDPDRMIATLKRTGQLALEEGYAGLRVTGEMTWVFAKLPGVERLIEYEAKLNYFLPGSRSTAICQYHESRFDPDILIDVIHTHPRVVIYGSVCENPYYIPPEEFLLRMQHGKVPLAVYLRIRDDIIVRTEQERGRKRTEAELRKSLDNAERSRLALLSTLEDWKGTEEALRESEERFRRVSLLTSDIAYSCTTTGGSGYKISWMVGATDRIFGYSIDEVKAKRCWGSLVLEEDAGLFQKNVTGLEPGASAFCELRVCRKDGTTAWVLSNAECISDPKDPVRFILYGAITDITERKNAEEALKEAQVFTESALNAITDIFYSFDLSGKFLSWNKTFNRISGYSDQELSSKKPIDFFLGDDIQRVAEAVEKIYKEGTSKVEANFIVKDGRQIPCEFTGSILKDSKGNIIGFSGTGRDITERKNAEEKMRIFSNAVQNAYDGFMLTDMNGNVTYANGSAIKIFGYSHEEMLKLKVPQFTTDPKDANNIVEEIKNKSKWSGEIINIRKNKEKFPVLLSVSIVKDGKDNPIGMMGIFRDITERKKMEVEILSLSKFPSENPNPVLRIAEDGTILYSNKKGLGVLAKWDAKIGGKAPDRWCRLIKERFDAGKTGSEEEEEEGEIFSIVIAPVKEAGYANLYFRDVTERKKAEYSLKASEEKFRRLFEGSMDAIFIIDKERGIFDCNHAALKLFRVSGKEELVGKHLEVDLSPEKQPDDIDSSVLRSRYIKKVSKGKGYFFEWVYRRQDASLFTAEVFLSALSYQGSDVFQAVLRDITERKKAEEGVAYDYDIHRTIGLFLKLSLEDISLNEFLKKSLELILSIPWLSLESRGAIFLVEDDPEVLVMKAQQGLSEYIQKACHGVPFGKCHCGKAALTKEIEFADRIGTRHEIYYEGMAPHGHYCVPILYSDKVLGVLNTYLREGYKRNEGIEHSLVMLTNALAAGIEKKMSEQAQKRLVEILETTPDFVGFADAKDKHLIYINKAGRKMTGIGADEDVAKLKIFDVHPEWTNKMFADEILPAAMRDGTWKGECAFLNIRDGHEIPVSMVLSAHKASGGEVEVFSTISRDITDRRKVEESQRLAQLGQLVAAMAHEVNNPLMIISGNAQLALMEELKSRELKDELGIIVDQCERAKDIIQRLLKFARPTKGVVKKTGINDCIETAVKFLEHQYSLSNIKMIRSYTASLPAIAIDEKQMQEVFLNLFSNSFDAMPGGGTITIKTSRTAKNIRIDVADTGIGITEENLKKMSTPFFTTKEKGTGLGLAVCYGIVRAHNGEIKYESKSGEGTTVTILLPMEGGGGG